MSILKKSFNKLIGKKEIEPEEEIDEYEEDIVDSNKTVDDLNEAKMVEYIERQNPAPESEEELIAKLFEVEAKLSNKKEIVRIMDKSLQIERDIAIESADEYPEIFITDGTKGDMNDGEIVSCFLHGVNAIEDRVDGKAYDFPLMAAAEFDAKLMHLRNHLTRGRNGFSVKYSRSRISAATIERKSQDRADRLKKKNSFLR